jgi:hypothetical protein
VQFDFFRFDIPYLPLHTRSQTLTKSDFKNSEAIEDKISLIGSNYFGKYQVSVYETIFISMQKRILSVSKQNPVGDASKIMVSEGMKKIF